MLKEAFCFHLSLIKYLPGCEDSCVVHLQKYLQQLVVVKKNMWMRFLNGI